MPIPYKLITLSEKEILRIAGNAGAHADLMARDLTERWRDQLPKGQKTVNLKQAQTCVRHDLHELRRQIVEIEREHLKELAADVSSRLERDENRPLLRERLIGIQGLFESSFGGGSSDKVFGPGVLVIPIDPLPLRRLGFIAYENLTSSDLVLGEPRIPGVRIEPRKLAQGFKGPLDRLDRVLVELGDTLPASNRSLEKKMRKLEELQTQVGIAARFLEALYHLAGHDVIAERVRLSSRRARRLSAAAGEDEREPRDGDESPRASEVDFPFEQIEREAANNEEDSSEGPASEGPASEGQPAAAVAS